MKVFIVCLVILSGLACSSAPAAEEVNIRINQVGYYPDKIKLGIAFSKMPLNAKEFRIIDAKTKKTVYKNEINDNLGKWGNYDYHYKLDFTSLSQPGSYLLELAGKKSAEFKIRKDLYAGVIDSLLKFFQIQRCGPTNPFLHKTCHLFDSPNVVGDKSVQGIDVTGGWHDAGDYIKFLNTSAYTTYMLLFSYEQNQANCESDENKNGSPDILEEARVGIDWLLRCNYSQDRLINQVQDNRDHEFTWRLPEDDSLRYDRPAFRGEGKSLIGIYTASLAIAARVWKDRFHDEAFAKRCLDIAEKIFASREKAPDVDKTNTGMYVDQKYFGKLALGAVELYISTGKQDYLDEAKRLADKAQSDYWWSWGDINSLAHFRLAKYSPEYTTYILNNVQHFNDLKNKNIFSEGAAFSWGTTNTLLGVALQAILLKRLVKGDQYDSLIVAQLDYILGKNPWGVSFIYDFGTTFTKNFHSQVAYLNHGYFPGAIAAGPAPLSVYAGTKINRNNNRYSEFNSNEIVYYDDRVDYITNEPTIVTDATAVFVFTSDFILGK